MLIFFFVFCHAGESPAGIGKTIFDTVFSWLGANNRVPKSLEECVTREQIQERQVAHLVEKIRFCPTLVSDTRSIQIEELLAKIKGKRYIDPVSFLGKSSRVFS